MSGDLAGMTGIALVAFLLCAVAGAALEAHLKYLLRTRYATIWDRLGEPYYWSGSQRAIWAFLRFLWSREARALRDATWRLSLRAYWVVSVAGVMAAAAFFTSNFFRH
jgi:hypothetical protein